MAPTNAASDLAHRLRELRESRWGDVRVTQRDLARALGVSPPLLSSWERLEAPVIPNPQWVTEIARFFCTHRSVEAEPVRLLGPGELTADERMEGERLKRELLRLREATLGDGSGGDRRGAAVWRASDPWRFPDSKPIRIVCAKLPPELLARMPYTRPEDPDYDELYTFTDLDALFELHGHIRAVNPGSDVRFMSAGALTPDDYVTHLVSLGGVDWNAATRHMLRLLKQPVSQVSRHDDPEGAHFRVDDGKQGQRFHPILQESDAGRILTEDVAHFFRGPNPLNRRRTVTICNGMFGRGTLGAVRALTDANFRDRNAAYLAERFAGHDTFSILTRVRVVDGAVVTPDWTLPETRLHEWPEAIS